MRITLLLPAFLLLAFVGANVNPGAAATPNCFQVYKDSNNVVYGCTDTRGFTAYTVGNNGSCFLTGICPSLDPTTIYLPYACVVGGGAQSPYWHATTC